MKWQGLEQNILACQACPRLRRHCERTALQKKREFREWAYWGKPVPGFGDPKARLWIVGLAPAAHGANRTGRMFTGDSSGQWLYRALYKAGFANQPTSTARNDGLELKGAYVSSAARCAPPDNKPLPEELERCSPFLDREWALLSRVEVVVALGNIAFQALWRLGQRQGLSLNRPRPLFQHGALYPFGKKKLLLSYHPSRQNTQTKRLTEPMLDAIFKRVRKELP